MLINVNDHMTLLMYLLRYAIAYSQVFWSGDYLHYFFAKHYKKCK